MHTEKTGERTADQGGRREAKEYEDELSDTKRVRGEFEDPLWCVARGRERRMACAWFLFHNVKIFISSQDLNSSSQSHNVSAVAWVHVLQRGTEASEDGLERIQRRENVRVGAPSVLPH